MSTRGKSAKSSAFVYVLEGSAQRDQNHAGQCAADRRRRPAIIFGRTVSTSLSPISSDVQDDIVARLAGQLGAELISGEARRAERAPSPIRWTSIFRESRGTIKDEIQEDVERARGFFERALGA